MGSFTKLFFHLFSQKSGSGTQKFFLCFAGLIGVLTQQHHTAADIACGDDGKSYQSGALYAFHRIQRMLLRGKDIALSLVAQLLESRGNSSLQQLLFRDTGGSDHMVTVTDDHRFTTGLVQDVRILGSKADSSPMGEYFLKMTSPSLLVKISNGSPSRMRRVPADFLGNDHTTQVIDSSNDSGSFHNSTLSLSVWFVLIVFAVLRENMQAVLAAFFKREGK